MESELQNTNHTAGSAAKAGKRICSYTWKEEKLFKKHGRLTLNHIHE